MKPKNSSKKLVLLLSMVLCMVLAGCGSPRTANGGDVAEADKGIDSKASATSDDSQVAASEKADSSQTAASDTAESSSVSQTATLYIGTRSAGFSEYPLSYEGSLTPELLIQGIADLTGWNLTLAEPVSTGKGGMSVCLSDGSSLFTGPPEPQKDEFHMFGADQLAQTILDSIQKTLQMGFTGEDSNPDALDIYYFMEGEKPLELPNIGMSWPLDQPYRWDIPSGG